MLNQSLTISEIWIKCKRVILAESQHSYVVTPPISVIALIVAWKVPKSSGDSSTCVFERTIYSEIRLVRCRSKSDDAKGSGKQQCTTGKNDSSAYLMLTCQCACQPFITSKRRLYSCLPSCKGAIDAHAPGDRGGSEELLLR